MRRATLRTLAVTFLVSVSYTKVRPAPGSRRCAAYRSPKRQAIDREYRSPVDVPKPAICPYGLRRWNRFRSSKDGQAFPPSWSCCGVRRRLVRAEKISELSSATRGLESLAAVDLMRQRFGEIFDRAWQLNVCVLLRGATPGLTRRNKARGQMPLLPAARIPANVIGSVGFTRMLGTHPKTILEFIPRLSLPAYTVPRILKAIDTH